MEYVGGTSQYLVTVGSLAATTRQLATARRILRCFRVLDLGYLVTGLALTLSALSVGLGHSLDNVVCGAALLGFSVLSSVCNSLALHGLGLCHRSYLLPWLVIIIIVIMIMVMIMMMTGAPPLSDPAADHSRGPHALDYRLPPGALPGQLSTSTYLVSASTYLVCGDQNNTSAVLQVFIFIIVSGIFTCWKHVYRVFALLGTQHPDTVMTYYIVTHIVTSTFY